MMVVVFSDPANNWMEAASNLLGESEAAYFSTLRFAGRQRSYLLGRYAAKTALSAVISEREIGWLNLRAAEPFEFASALLAAKESLSKVLQTGLMANIRVYDLAEFNLIDSREWEGFFENFAQYKARVWIGSKHVLAIAVPKRSTLILEDQPYNIF